MGAGGLGVVFRIGTVLLLLCLVDLAFVGFGQPETPVLLVSILLNTAFLVFLGVRIRRTARKQSKDDPTKEGTDDSD